MTPLYGRAELLDRARRPVERACAGEGQVVLFTGEPGIGKSSLAEHVAAQAASLGARVAWGRCWEVGGAPAYWPWMQVFQELDLPDDPFAGALSDVAVGTGEARFTVFDRAVRALKERAQRSPLCLVLDDLHAADHPSLLLLLLLARQRRHVPLLIVGAYRDAELRAQLETAAALAKLQREAEVYPLPRLAAADVAAWVGTERADELYRLTEGHPLFLVEALRGAPGAPGGLGGAIDEHLCRLSPQTRAVVEEAAVVGREFASEELSGDADLVHRALTDAVATSVVVPAGTRFRFAHVLLRDRLYGQLIPSVRTGLHTRVGETLLRRGDQGSAVHHFLAARDPRVAEVALVAAEAALCRLAFEEAMNLARGALEIVTSAPLQLVLAEAYIRLGRADEGRALCLQAAEHAPPELLARAALVYATELSSGLLEVQMVALLRRALAALPPGDTGLRARVMARLSAALTPPSGPDTVPGILGLMREATAMARRLGDRHALLYVLQFAATVSLLVPEHERLAFMQETVDLATALNQRLVLLQAFPAYLTALLARGQRAIVNREWPRYQALLADSPQPLHHVHGHLLQALFAALEGRWDDADRESSEAHATAIRGGSLPGRRLWLTQRLALALLSGRLDVVNEIWPGLLPTLGSFSTVPYHAWVMANQGRSDEARALLAQMHLQPQRIPAANLMELLGAADCCVVLGDVALGARLYPAAVQAVDRMFFVLSPGAVFGPTGRTLGDLAALIGKPTEARRHYDEAIAFCERMGATAPLALTRRARAALDDGTPAASHASNDGFSLRRDGELWALTTFAGATVRLKPSKGLVYLQRLIERPGQELHVLDLAGVEHDGGDAGPLLDTRAKEAYKARLTDLREERDEAESFGDAVRARRMEAEIAALTEQLAAAVGLGGRDRRGASTVERARINVQRCLKDALDRITAADPGLGRYLSAAVKSGTYCAYRPL